MSKVKNLNIVRVDVDTIKKTAKSMYMEMNEEGKHIYSFKEIAHSLKNTYNRYYMPRDVLKWSRTYEKRNIFGLGGEEVTWEMEFIANRVNKKLLNSNINPPKEENKVSKEQQIIPKTIEYQFPTTEERAKRLSVEEYYNYVKSTYSLQSNLVEGIFKVYWGAFGRLVEQYGTPDKVPVKELHSLFPPWIIKTIQEMEKTFDKRMKDLQGDKANQNIITLDLKNISDTELWDIAGFVEDKGKNNPEDKESLS